MEDRQKLAINYLILGSLFLFVAVAIGAFGAHGLKKIVEPKMLETFETGVRYHFYHSFGLISLGLIAANFSIRPKPIGLCFFD